MRTNDKNPRARGAPITGLRWFEIHFDRELTRADIVRGLQPLAYRSRVGWRRWTSIERRGHDLPPEGRAV